jgi:hypothetical protein
MALLRATTTHEKVGERAYAGQAAWVTSALQNRTMTAIIGRYSNAVS